MSVLDDFVIRGGSVRGTDHIRKGVNNHDSLHMAYDEVSDSLIGIVCDGCGSGQDSEVGAKIASKLVSTSIVRHLMHSPLPNIWGGVRKEVCSHIHSIALAMESGIAVQEVISENFLFTILGFVISPQITVNFWIGDGCHAISRKGKLNPELLIHEPEEGNCPPYISYNLVNTSIDFGETGLEFQVVQMPTSEVEGVLVATDGILQMNDEQDVPVKPNNPDGEKVGSLIQFLTQPPYLLNKFSVQRKLARLNPYRPILIPDWGNEKVLVHQGLLNDDTSVVVARRAERINL